MNSTKKRNVKNRKWEKSLKLLVFPDLPTIINVKRESRVGFRFLEKNFIYPALS